MATVKTTLNVVEEKNRSNSYIMIGVIIAIIIMLVLIFK
jgi:hypothetical protein